MFQVPPVQLLYSKTDESNPILTESVFSSFVLVTAIGTVTFCRVFVATSTARIVTCAGIGGLVS